MIKILPQPSACGQHSLRFEIHDTGIGMSPEGQARLFQPFAQADSSTARRFGGTGLGLSISKSLVEAMQGNIGVESALEKGTHFWFNLPLQPAGKIASTLLNADPAVTLQGRRVLVVDDNVTNRKILNHYLQHWGVLVRSTGKAADALSELEAGIKRGEAYDLVLSDYHMPEMDGYALARAINSNPLIAATPRLLLSSGGMDSKADRQELGFAQSLIKPIRQTQLFEAMVNALQGGAIKSPPVKTINEQTNYSHKRILVVEDNMVNQKVIIAMLAKFQCIPDMAHNGQEALDKIALNHYDLVFMDCQMPVMDGYEAVRRLRGQELTHKLGRIPVIALTAHAAAEERDKCLAVGMDDFLTKPITRLNLANALAYWLSTPKTEVFAPLESAIETHPIASIPCWDETATLENLENDLELLYSIMHSFIEETPDKLQQLINAKDLVTISEVAHGFTSMGGLFNAMPLRTYARELERNARLNKPVDYQHLTQNLTAAARQLMAAFTEYLAKIAEEA